jgi:transposase
VSLPDGCEEGSDTGQASADLLRRGLVYRESGNWTVKHLAWLRRVKLANEIDQLVFDDYLGEIERLDERLRRLDSHIEALSEEKAWREAVGRLRCFRGLDTVSSMVIATEIFDFSRFKEARQFMGFLGIVPGLNESSDKRKELSLTKTGNSHVRRILVQAAWNYRYRPTVGHRLRKRREGQSERVIAIADKAQSRLYRRYNYLAHHRQLLSTKAVVAIARELSGFIWSAMLDLQPVQENQDNSKDLSLRIERSGGC